MLAADQLAVIEKSPYKQDFPLLAKNPDIVFLDSAATSQRPEAVLAAERTFYETMNANPLRGLYRLSVEATAAIEDARRHIAAFIGAVDDAGKPQGNEVVFTRNASESLNLVAHTLPQVANLGPGDEVVISIMEHHSNLIDGCDPRLPAAQRRLHHHAGRNRDKDWPAHQDRLDYTRV